MAAPTGNKNHYKYGLSHTRIDNIYKLMIDRCSNPNNSKYTIYGGRRIKVCDEWKNDKTKFFEWAFANGYSEELTIDRIDSNGNYEPSNCKWATYKEQANNRRNNIRIPFNGKIYSVSGLAEITGIKAKTIYSRYKKRWDVGKILGGRFVDS